MKTKLRLLLLEDDPNDAEIEITTLEDAGFRCDWKRVETEATFLSHFEAGGYDLVLSDFALPSFNGLDALRLVRERDTVIPFILVSGTVGEDAAIRSLRSGATDYVLKSRLSRLPPVVERALGEYAEQQARRKAQQELEKSEGRVLTLFNTVPDLVFMKDLDGKYLGCNKAYERLCGLTEKELVGKTAFDIMDRKRAESSRKDDRWALEEGGPVQIEEQLTFAEDGYVGHFEIIKSPMRDTNGEVFGIMGVARDITDRKKAETEQRRMAAVINQIVEAVVITSPTGEIQYVNPSFEQMTGYQREEVLGKNPNMWKSGRHDSEFYRDLWDNLLRNGWWSGRFLNKKKDGTIFTEEATISAVRNASGSIVNYVAVKRDITKETELEAMVRQSQKMEAVGRLAGGLAHDLNNILQTISAFSSVLLMEIKEQESLRSDVHEIQQATKRASNLTQQLLTFSRKQPTELVPVDLNEIIATEYKMLDRLLGPHVTMAFEPDRELLQVHADPCQIEQVIMNLVVNARDAMPDGGEIFMRTRNVVFPNGVSAPESPYRHSGRYVCISVSDTGSGMDEEIRSHLFEPFFTTKPVGEGTGLGLAVIYGIVEQHNGWIDVESKKGKGSEFKVFLPALENT